MKRTTHKLLALVLTLLLLLACVTPAFAAAEAPTPVIVISGMNSFPLYLDEVKEENQVWPPSGKAIAKLVIKSLPSLAKSLITRDLNIFADANFEDVFDVIFGAVACDEEGNSIHNIVYPTFPLSAGHYPDEILNSKENEDEMGIVKGLVSAMGGDSVWFFNYDWRLDPMQDAKDLKAFIDSVKTQSGADRVTLVPCSMGGAVVDAYLSLYGSDGIEKIIYTMVASKGIDLVGELFNGNVTLDLSVLTERLFNFKEGEWFAQAMLSLLKTVTDGTPGMNALVSRFANWVLDTLSDRAYGEIFARSLVTMPGMWAFVPDSHYESAKAKLFPNGGNKTFIDKIDAYHYGVQNNAETLLQAAKDNGTDLYVLAAYGFVGFPMTDLAYVQSDCLIETKNESFGATVAPYGKTLGDGYTAAGTVCADKTHQHLSTDGIVDASTCLLPEQTWFIKFNRHVGFPVGTETTDLMVWLVTAETPVDVRSDARFPQFVKLNLMTGKLESLTGDTVKPSILDKESNTALRALRLLREAFDGIKAKISG